VASRELSVKVAGLSFGLQPALHIGSLRYFDAAGPMAANVREVVGGPLPGPRAAVRYALTSSVEIVLAWRSPTETLIMTTDEAALAAVADRAAPDPSAGCLVDQTGGLRAWQLGGERARDLLVRIGSAASVPAFGEARISRIAELPVLVACVRDDAFCLLAERVYGEHLVGWIRETAADF
jgi:sarcosine oxidase gamma subunit